MLWKQPLLYKACAIAFRVPGAEQRRQARTRQDVADLSLLEQCTTARGSDSQTEGIKSKKQVSSETTLQCCVVLCFVLFFFLSFFFFLCLFSR